MIAMIIMDEAKARRMEKTASVLHEPRLVNREPERAVEWAEVRANVGGSGKSRLHSLCAYGAITVAGS